MLNIESDQSYIESEASDLDSLPNKKIIGDLACNVVLPCGDSMPPILGVNKNKKIFHFQESDLYVPEPFSNNVAINNVSDLEWRICPIYFIICI